MKAITITTELKQANTELFSGQTVGAIRTFATTPRTFFSLNYNAGKRTDGYNTLSNSVHQSDGFYNVITPAYDEAIQKLGAIFFNVDHFTYPVVAKTQQEQDDYIQQQEDNDNASLTFQQHKNDGVIGFDRAYALIQRRFDNSIITGAQAKSIAQALYPVIEPLYKGQWQLVKINLDAETPPVNQDLLNIFNIIKTKVDEYVAANY